MFNSISRLFYALLFCSICNNVLSQSDLKSQSFHIGIAGISTITTSTYEGQLYKSLNPIDFGVYCGNEFDLKGRFSFDLEFFYLNNRVEISRVDEYKFELHQNIGCLLKTGFELSKHTVFLDLGMSGVYVFDKKVGTGNQLDRFDQAVLCGLAYDFSIRPNLSLQLSFLHAKFHSISHWTGYELLNFSTISLATIYYLE